MSAADDPPLLFVVSLGVLRPANDISREAMAALSGRVRIRITRATPNVKRMAWYWVMLKLAADNMADKVDGGLSAKLLHRILKRKLKLGREIVLPSGEVFFDEESISFAAMTEIDRAAWVKRVSSVLAKWLGVPLDTLTSETNERDIA